MSNDNVIVMAEAARAIERARLERDEARGELAALQVQRERDLVELERLRRQKDGAYSERNKVVAALARLSLAPGLGADVCIAHHEGKDWEDDWRTILVIWCRAGQLTWHFHDSERPLLEGIRAAQPGEHVWDGHSTEEKYTRLERWARGLP